MAHFLETIERSISGTRFEKTVRLIYSEISSIGKPRARQSAAYDRQTVEIISRVVDRNATCIDIGAHRSGMLMHLVEHAPEGTVYALEPLPHLAARMRERWHGSRQVVVIEAAASDSTGSKTFCHVVDSPGKSGFRRMSHIAPDARVEEISVWTDTLDNFIPDDERIRFIKVDVEGAQLEVFRGATRILKHDRPYAVFEHGMLAQESYGTTSDMVYEVLVSQCGLKLSLLADWLAGKPPLTQQAFARNVGYHAGSHFCFLAHPS